MKRPRLEFSRELTYLYHEYNQKYFKGQLKNLEVYFERTKKRRYGYASITEHDGAQYIAINGRLKNWAEVAMMALLHECIHVRFPYEKEDHGEAFKKEKRRLIVAGALDDLI